MHSRDWFEQIHSRLLATDPVAPAELVEGVIKDLIAGLEKKYRRLRDSDQIQDAATDALVDYIKRPGQYDPAKRGLLGFLLMAAERDLLNAIAKRRRRSRKEIIVDDVELLAAAGNIRTGVPEVDEQLDNQQAHHKQRMRLEKIFKDPKDIKAAELVLSRERSTKVFAKIWGLECLPLSVQAEQVKRHKDRIKVTLRRHEGK